MVVARDIDEILNIDALEGFPPLDLRLRMRKLTRRILGKPDKGKERDLNPESEDAYEDPESSTNATTLRKIFRTVRRKPKESSLHTIYEAENESGVNIPPTPPSTPILFAPPSDPGPSYSSSPKESPPSIAKFRLEESPPSTANLRVFPWSAAFAVAIHPFHAPKIALDLPNPNFNRGDLADIFGKNFVPEYEKAF
ncbi:hypothetical protein FQN49_002546 [Arthroderma sp. PD_2]|nr:hypothetical protein FQN49_002546 [Arthroderma sp. PD_2]